MYIHGFVQEFRLAKSNIITIALPVKEEKYTPIWNLKKKNTFEF